MKYNVKDLLKIIEDNQLLKGRLGVELSYLINEAISIKIKLEKTEEKLLTPARKDIDIMTHARLIKEYGENRRKQISILTSSGTLLNGIAERLERDYDETVKLIKAQ